MDPRDDLELERPLTDEARTSRDIGLADEDVHQSNVAPAVRLAGLADKALPVAWTGSIGGIGHAEDALTTQPR